jgi:hypothetical protein
VAKVKKRAGVTGVRNVKVRKAKSPARTLGTKSTGKTPAKTPAKTPPTKSKAPRSAARAGPKGRRAMKKVAAKKKAPRKGVLALLPARKGRPAPPPPVVRVAVRELDPQRKCGAGTSVQFLYRVDETVDGRSTAHLVFFDRHGWYCEHGRTCPAVGHARKRNGQIARVS